MSQLTDLKGIGDKTAEKLVEKGIKTVADIAVLRSSELAELLGWSKLKALETINDAKERALTVAMVLYDKDEFNENIEKMRQYFSTGSRKLDALLGGGIATMELTALRGPFSSGKSQICYSAAVSALEKGKEVAWIEVESGTLFTERLDQIAKSRGVTYKPSSFISVPAKMITSTNLQFVAYQRIERELQRGRDIGLIVIDSFSPKFREEYPLREQFPARSQEIARHIGFLQGLASKYNLSVLLTAQIMGVPDTDKANITRMKEASEEAVALGHVLKHGVQTWISVQQISKANLQWKATLIDSSHLPPGEAVFMIDGAGVRDTR